MNLRHILARTGAITPVALLLILPAAAMAQTGATLDLPPGIGGKDLGTAAGILGITFAVAWKLLTLLELMIRDKLGLSKPATPITPAAASDALGTLAATLMADRNAVLAATKQVDDVWKVTAEPDTNRTPRLLAHQSALLSNQVNAIAAMKEAQVSATAAQDRQNLQIQASIVAQQASIAAQDANTAATQALVAVIRDALNQGVYAARAERAGRTGP